MDTEITFEEFKEICVFTEEEPTQVDLNELPVLIGNRLPKESQPQSEPDQNSSLNSSSFPFSFGLRPRNISVATETGIHSSRIVLPE